MRQTPTHKLSPNQRRAEIVQILVQAVRRLANSLPNLPETLGNSEESEESSLAQISQQELKRGKNKNIFCDIEL